MSFILVTAALGCVLLSALYIVIDVIKIWDGEPFVFPGMFLSFASSDYVHFFRLIQPCRCDMGLSFYKGKELCQFPL